jgi:hypothetical protein
MIGNRHQVGTAANAGQRASIARGWKRQCACNIKLLACPAGKLRRFELAPGISAHLAEPRTFEWVPQQIGISCG